ncbi:MAG: DUF2630 family protein [Actinomycetota bacterium]|nr:DUF2630 family protein [Actinomycetota bacterium]
MEEREVLDCINELVNEEHELYHRAGKGGMSAREHERLRQLEVNLDRCWISSAAPGTQGGRLRPGRDDRRRLPAATPQPGCGAPGRSLA